jgi:uncharacterized protein
MSRAGDPSRRGGMESRRTTPAADVLDVVTRLFRAVEKVDATAYFDRTYRTDVVIAEAPALPYGGTYRGIDGAVEHAVAFMDTWAPHRRPGDASMDAAIDAVPGHAYVRWTLRVAGRGFPFLSHYRFRDGLVAEARMYPFEADGLVAWWAELRAASTGPGGR